MFQCSVIFSLDRVWSKASSLPSLQGDLSCLKMIAAGEELVLGHLKIHAEKLQLVVELEDVPVSFMVPGNLGCDLPVIQFGRGSQDDVEGGGRGMDAA